MQMNETVGETELEVICTNFKYVRPTFNYMHTYDRFAEDSSSSKALAQQLLEGSGSLDGE